jgi:molybdopterin-guanine dinucleotide biosynthesis protein A
MGGGDKGLQSLGRSTMLGEVARRLEPQVKALVLNANGDPSRFAALGLPVVADTVEACPGPLAGVLAGMRWSRANVSGATHVLTVSSDAPFLPRDLAARLAAGLPPNGCGIAIASSNGIVHPVIGLWPIALADELETSLHRGERKVQAWAERHGATRVEFPMLSIAGEMIDPFFNANTPAELDEARRLLDLVHA